MKRNRAMLCLWMLPLLALLAPRPALPTVPTDGERYVALTFDDGPWPETTETLLDGLAARGAKATFFLIGEQIAGQEETVRRMAREGHQVGNHTFAHIRLDGAVSEGQRDIARTEAALTELLGGSDYWIRPPWGSISESLAARLPVPLVYWSLDPEDWRVRDTQRVVSAILRDVKDGDIILLHDPYRTSVEAALQVVDALSAQGYRFVTVQELLERSGVTPEPGVLYRGVSR